MKIFKNRKTLIVLIIIVVLILVGVILAVFFKPESKAKPNAYDFEGEVVELPNTVTYTNDKLNEKHCIEDICIGNVTFYYNDLEGRVEYTITNNSKTTRSGYLKMVFNDQELSVIYKDLRPKKTINSRSQYMGMEIKDKSNYSLRKMTKEEISKITK